MIKRILCLMCIVVTVLSCSIAVNAENLSDDIVITNMTDEEINDLLQVQLYTNSSSTLNIAKWTKCIDNAQAESYQYSVKYYFPTYNGVAYNKYAIVKGKTGSAIGTNKYRLIYFNNNITWNTQYNNFANGTIIMIEENSIDVLKDYLFSETYDRTAINAIIMTSTENTTWDWSNGYSQTHHFNNTNHSDQFYVYYKATHDIEPPYLNEDGTCFEHNFDENGVCILCGAEKDKEEDNEGILAKVGEWFKNLIDTITNGFQHFKDWTANIATKIGDFFSTVTTAIADWFRMVTDWQEIPEASSLPDWWHNVEAIIGLNLSGNGFYESICVIKDELTSLYKEDYTDPNGFYNLGVTDFTLRKPYRYVSIDHGNEVIGPWEQTYEQITSDIDYGIDGVQLLNLDWFFGRNLGNGYYSTGVKEYSDAIIGSFMWLVFGWYLFHSFPELIGGELGIVQDLTSPIKTQYTATKKISEYQTTKSKKGESDE